MLLALILCLSLIMPAADINVYAVSGSQAAAEEHSSEAAPKTGSQDNVSASDQKVKAAPAATSVSGYAKSFNKRYSEELKIEADVTPSGGRDIQLQRYSSADNTWTAILTTASSRSADPVEASLKESAADAEDENTAASESAGSEPVTVTEENGSAHVTFNVPKEERQKTTSVWRIYVPATANASEACSDNITVITRNLESLSMSAGAACIYRIDGDGQGTMIYSRKSYNKVAQASTTKLMTAVLLLESGMIDSATTISSHSAATPYGSGRLAAGDVYSNRDLLYAMLLPSSNDAATAVAESVGGSEAAFVNQMNAKAEALGLTRTHFRNPHGLDADGHYTTALELAKLTAYAYNFPEIRDCWATKYKTIKSLKKGRKWTLWSTNAIFGYVSNFLGGKTGTENNARCCFTGVYTYGGSTYVTVVLGSGYGFARWSDTKKLHKYIQDYALSSY